MSKAVRDGEVFGAVPQEMLQGTLAPADSIHTFSLALQNVLWSQGAEHGFGSTFCV